MIRLLFIVIIAAVAAPVFSQQSLRGRILAADNKTPVLAASIFLSNTSVGTVSKEDGTFVITDFPNGRYDLVVSSLGYETFTIAVQSNKLPTSLDVFLKPKVRELQEIILEPYEKNGWEKWGEFFMENLIGQTPNANDCKLLNPESVKFRFSKKKNVLAAYSDEPLLIINNALGYELRYDLVQFEFNFRTRIFFYQGFPLFKELETEKSRIEKRWTRNRIEAYQGSLMHFMRSLYRNKIIEEGFEVRRLIKPKNSIVRLGEDPNSANILINKLLTGDSIAHALDSTTAGLQFENYLHIVYPKKRMHDSYMTKFRLKGSNSMTAELYMPDPAVTISVLANGSYFYGKDLLTSAFWAWSEKLSNMLPLDYRPQ